MLINLFRQAAKDEEAEDGKKKKGGVQVPKEWPWEAAKKIFQEPDVLLADEVEVVLLCVMLLSI
jgi:flap endonuclease-1